VNRGGAVGAGCADDGVEVCIMLAFGGPQDVVTVLLSGESRRRYRRLSKVLAHRVVAAPPSPRAFTDALVENNKASGQDK
jgi:hypothetical protein